MNVQHSSMLTSRSLKHSIISRLACESTTASSTPQSLKIDSEWLFSTDMATNCTLIEVVTLLTKSGWYAPIEIRATQLRNFTLSSQVMTSLEKSSSATGSSHMLTLLLRTAKHGNTIQTKQPNSQMIQLLSSTGSVGMTSGRL